MYQTLSRRCFYPDSSDEEALRQGVVIEMWAGQGNEQGLARDPKPGITGQKGEVASLALVSTARTEERLAGRSRSPLRDAAVRFPVSKH